jgi:hypothetical protein
MNAFLFVPLLAVSSIVVFALVLFLAHTLHVIVSETAGGNDEVAFPGETVSECFWKIFYFALLIVTWGLPSLLLCLKLAKTLDPKTLALAAGLFALLFPVGVLSSLATPSPFNLFVPSLYYRMLQKLGGLIGFYLLSILPVAGFFAWLALAVGRPTSIGMVALFALTGALGWVLYTRLIGKYAYSLSFTQGWEKDAPKEKKRIAPVPTPVDAKPKVKAKKISEMRGVITPEGEVTGYNLSGGLDIEVLEEKQIHPDALDDVPLKMRDVDDSRPPPPLPEETYLRPAQSVVVARDEDVESYARRKKARSKVMPDSLSTFGFLGQAAIFRTFVLLFLGMMLLGTLSQGLRALNPNND